jgi:hypothetical protein
MADNETTLTAEQIHATAEFWFPRTAPCWDVSGVEKLVVLRCKNFAGECYEWFRASDHWFLRGTAQEAEWCRLAFRDTPKALHVLALSCGMPEPDEEEVS